MNCIINGFHSPKQLKIIDKIVIHFNIELLIHICDSKYVYNNFDKSIEVQRIFHYLAGNAKYDLQNCEPIDEELIEKMASYETVVLKMCDRLEYYEKRTFSYYDRKFLYLKHLRYWNHILKNKKIDFFIGSNVPHEIYDYVILGLCNIYNIPVYFFLQSQIIDLIHPMTNWEENCKKILFEYHRLKEKENIEYAEFVLNEWKIQNSNSSPFYMKSSGFFQKLSKIKISLDNFFRPHIFLYKFTKNLKRYSDNKKLKRIYTKLCSPPDFKTKYFYVALHFQPEMTTSPIGGAYVDQFLIIEMLDKFLPPEINIYVKEHPKQEISGRTFNYYDNILNNKRRVKLMPLNTNTFDLIENSMAVVTVSGTVGWESLFRKKPVLLFGHNFYQYAPGVFMIKTNEDCLYAISKILDEAFLYNEADLKCFLQATYNCSIKGVIDPLYEVVSKIGIEESNTNIVNWIKDNIRYS